MAQPFFGRREPDISSLRSASAAPAASNPVPPSLQPSASAAASTVAGRESAARLTVGPNIKLKGVEITDCDTLVVEGTVEATMKSRVIEIAEAGAFTGEAEIEVAQIHGRFEGQLTVRDRLVIHATGRVSGKVSYGKLVIAEGGQLSGEVQVGAGVMPAAQSLARVA